MQIGNEKATILVDAKLEDLEELLRKELAPDEFAKLEFAAIPDPETSLLGASRGVEAQEVLIAAVHFLFLNAIGGYTHDLFKKVLTVLWEKYGKDRVFPPKVE